MAGFADLSVPELKDLLQQRGVDYSLCVEKNELISLCRRTAPDTPDTSAAVVAPAPAPTITNNNTDNVEMTLVEGVHHDIEQNTKQWFHIRRGDYNVRVGGSEIGVIVGVSPWAKPYSLWEKIIAQTDGTWINDEEENPPPCVHGNNCEPIIAGLYKYYIMEHSKNEAEQKLAMLDGGYYQHPDTEFGELYGASPDRRILDPEVGVTTRLVEIKAPFGRMYTHVKPEYMAQIQYQMWCSGIERCDFLAVKLDHDTPEKTIPSKIRVFLARVYRNEEYIQWMIPRLYLFSRYLILRQCPPRDLYESEATGLEIPPKVRVEEVHVDTGAWKLQECA